MLSKAEVLDALKDADFVPKFGTGVGRKIYEIAGPRGHFHIDYASFPGGTVDEVPRAVIDELERKGIIIRAYPDAPHINAWKLVKA